MSEPNTKVLLFEDNPADARLIKEYLAEELGTKAELECVSRLAQGQQRIAAGDIDVILLDLFLPDSRGLDTFATVHAGAPGVPIILLTGFNDEVMAVQAVRQGAQDYLVKGRVDGALLGRAIRYAIEREQSSKALRRAKQEWDQSFDALPDHLCVLDASGAILRANKTMRDRLEPIHGNLVGLDCRRVYYGTANPDPLPANAVEITGSPTVNCETALPTMEGWYAVSSYALFNDSGKQWGAVFVVRDITERKQAQEEKARLEEQLRLSQKLEAVGQLAGGIAHDFNNLLTAINGYSDMLLSDLSQDHPARHGLEQIQYAGERASSLTRQLLAFSRKQVLAPKVLILNTVVGSMEKLLRRLIGEDIALMIHPDANLGTVKADPGQLEQVLLNLAVNARDAMPSGGELTIETQNVELDEAFARTHAPTQAGWYVMLAVSDTGCGMDPDTQARIFEPFFTTKEQGKGTGLGLSTVYGIVKQSGGYVWVSSEPGQGAVFKIYLPRVAEPADSIPSDEAQPEALHGSEIILLVEDEVVVRNLARSVLELYGYTVLEAEHGKEALRIGQEHSGPIHLLLTDTVMPRMGGREVAKRLASVRPETKVLYMSGYTDKTIVQHGMLEPGTAFLQKPFTARVLARKVRETLDMASDQREAAQENTT